MNNQTQLVEGRIPPHTECPFRERCEIAMANECHHKGREHTVAFSCASARGFDLLNKYIKAAL